MSQQISLPHSTPEAQGIASSAVLAFVSAVDESVRELHSFMLLRHGHVVAEGWWNPYRPEYPHMLFSLSKSFTSTAAGIAIAEGHFSLDDTVVSFFPDEAPEFVSENLAAMQVRHLLAMATGHDKDATHGATSDPEGNWVRGFLAQAVEHTPGTHFAYNSAATYMVSAIVQKTTGVPVLEYLQPRLFAPLEILGATWENCPRGINVGGWGLNIKTDGIARFGQLYLQKGMWNGKRLLPEGWVAEATVSHISNGDNPESDWNQGYGFQFWRCRHGAYRGDGAFGQYCVVMPEQDAVVAITAGLGDMQSPLNLVWEHLLPALETTASLPEDSAMQEALTQKLGSLALRTPEGNPSSPIAAQVGDRTYRFEPNEQKVEAVTFTFGTDSTVLKLQQDQTEYAIPVGSEGFWLQSIAPADARPPRRVFATGAWLTENTYQLELCHYETPFCQTITCRFVDGQLLYNFEQNVAFGPKEHPQLVGIER